MLEQTGYVLRRPEEIAIKALLARPSNGVRALLLEGAPGTGKTFLAESLAKWQGAEYLYLLSHNWLSDEELFIGVDVGAVAIGVERREDAYRPGLLLRAVEASKSGLVIVCIDEIDKAPQRAENLLLDFLQSARVHGPRGEMWQGDPANIIVVLTSNGQRQLNEATLRRCFRLKMEFLPENVERDLLRKWTGASSHVIRCVVDMANAIRKNGSSSPSIQEMKYLILDLKQAQSASDVEILLKSSLVKSDEDWEVLGKCPAAVLWGEVRR